MDLKKYYSIFMHWLWLIVLGVSIASAAAYVITSQETPVYQASTRFIVLQAATASSYDYYSYRDYQQLILTYSQLLSTDTLLEKASEELGYSAYDIKAKASQIEDTQFVLLTVDHQDPIKAAEIANVLVKVLIDQNEKLQSVRYEATEQNLQQRANQALEQINLLQSQISEISITSVQEQRAQVETEIEKIQAQIIDIETEINTLQSNINNFNPEFATNEQITQNEAAKLRLAELNADKSQLEPVLDLYQQIYTNLIVLGRTTDSDSSASVELSQLQANLNLFQQIYVSSISNLESLKLSRAQNIPNVVQVEPAIIPQEPISPKPLQSTLLFGTVGLLVTSGIVFLLEYFDTTIKTPEDAENLLNLPIIGLVGELKAKRNGRNGDIGIFVHENPRSIASESFRSLRTNLEFSSVDHPIKTILVTSIRDGEGKTTVACNLALSIAKGGKQVLLLDTDFRRPAVHKKFGISNWVGFSDLLRRNLGPSILQYPIEDQNFSVLTAGTLPPNPAELLASERMSKILDGLKQRYDMIVIDSPPMFLADPHILSSKVDGVILVLEAAKTAAEIAITEVDKFRRSNAKLLGVVINRIPRNRNFYFGNYQLYQAKYYGKYEQLNEEYN